MTKLDRLYDRLNNEFPQLRPYLYRDTDKYIHVGVHLDNLSVSTLKVTPTYIVACGTPQSKGIMRSYTSPTDAIRVIEPHIDEMLRTLQYFESGAGPKVESNILSSLGFQESDFHRGTLESDDVIIEIFPPYCTTNTSYPLSWRLMLRASSRDQLFNERFDALDGLLNFISSWGDI